MNPPTIDEALLDPQLLGAALLVVRPERGCCRRNGPGHARFPGAVTPRQIKRLHLPTAPPKEGDKRAFAGQTCQAEAIAPDVLAGILRKAIEARLDPAAYAAVIKRERATQRRLARILRADR